MDNVILKELAENQYHFKEKILDISIKLEKARKFIINERENANKHLPLLSINALKISYKQYKSLSTLNNNCEKITEILTKSLGVFSKQFDNYVKHGNFLFYFSIMQNFDKISNLISNAFDVVGRKLDSLIEVDTRGFHECIDHLQNSLRVIENLYSNLLSAKVQLDSFCYIDEHTTFSVEQEEQMNKEVEELRDRTIAAALDKINKNKSENKNEIENENVN